MGLKNIFNKNAQNDADEILDIPGVVFEKLELQVAVGQWLGVLPSHKKIGKLGSRVNTPVDAATLMRISKITDDKLKKVQQEFGKVLKQAGIDSSDVCRLCEYEKDWNRFSCHFRNEFYSAIISISQSPFEPELIIDTPTFSKRYEYFPETKESPIRLKLKKHVKKNSKKGLEFYSIKHKSSYNGILYKKDETDVVDIIIGYPNSLEERNGKPYFDEAKMEELLLELSFPVKLEDLCESITALLFVDIASYPKFSIEVKKMKGEQEEVTDMMALENGQLTKFKRIIGEKIIIWDSQSGWTYKNPKWMIKQDNEGKVYCRLDTSLADLDSHKLYPSGQFAVASLEVEQAMALVKALLPKQQ